MARLFAAATILVLLALGPFASPQVSDASDGTAALQQVDHRNDVPVVQPMSVARGRQGHRFGALRLTWAAVVAVLVVAAALAGRRRPIASLSVPRAWLSWARPPLRGPPLLPAV